MDQLNDLTLFYYTEYLFNHNLLVYRKLYRFKYFWSVLWQVSTAKRNRNKFQLYNLVENKSIFKLMRQAKHSILINIFTHKSDVAIKNDIFKLKLPDKFFQILQEIMAQPMRNNIAYNLKLTKINFKSIANKPDNLLLFFRQYLLLQAIRCNYPEILYYIFKYRKDLYNNRIHVNTIDSVYYNVYNDIIYHLASRGNTYVLNINFLCDKHGLAILGLDTRFKPLLLQQYRNDVYHSPFDLYYRLSKIRNNKLYIFNIVHDYKNMVYPDQNNFSFKNSVGSITQLPNLFYIEYLISFRNDVFYQLYIQNFVDLVNYVCNYFK